MHSKLVFRGIFVGLLWISAAGSAELMIDASMHPLSEPLRALVEVPAQATAESPVPVCVIVHGSGGLFKEAEPGQACRAEPEANFAGLMELLANAGVATVAPSSFASRDPRFCEDNDDDYLQFAPAPFFNPGDGPIVRDDAYSIRRIVIRTLDLLAATSYACSLPEVDCERICLVGASNGGSTMMSYVANDLPRHLAEFTALQTRREHESSNSFTDRQTALANFPALPEDLTPQLAARPLPRFVHAVSPGCFLRQLVPTVDATDNDFDPLNDLGNLYYPAGETELHLEIGTADSVPSACYNGGIREIQARDFEAIMMVDPSRYVIRTHPGAGHDLLMEVTEPLHAKLGSLVNRHFFPALFGNGFEGEDPPVR